MGEGRANVRSQTGCFGLEHLLAWLAEGDAARAGDADRAGAWFASVTMTSRRDGFPAMAPGGLFVAVRAVRDGHDFVADAFANGARAALVAYVPVHLRPAVERGEVAVVDFRTPSGIANLTPASPQWGDPWCAMPAGDRLLVLVDDPVDVLQRCAGWWRKQRRSRVLAVTGSVGKTTTKELLANVLDRRYHVLRTEGNLNNEYGLPFTLLRLTPDVERAVVEIGISATGEMATFARIAAPNVAIVTRVSPAHLHRLGDLDTIELEKGALVEALPCDGVAVLNADDDRVARMAGRTPARAILYGESASAGVRASDVKSRDFEGIAFTIGYDGRQEQVEVPLVGRHFVTAALAAAAAGFVEGLPWEDVVAGLAVPAAIAPLRPLTLSWGVTLLDDTYNASPAAMRAALDVLAASNGRRIAVLGDMFELGDYAQAAHREVGAYVPERADLLVTVGELGREIAAAARDAGLPAHRVAACATNPQAIDHLRARLQAGDFVLIKGSRGMRMEEIVYAIAGREAPASRH